jgi:Tfp pilus assembly protein PilV
MDRLFKLGTPRRHRQLTAEAGIGLVELLIAMTIMSVAILALVAGLGSGYVALNRAGTISTAGTIADHQIERYRALEYSGIALNSSYTTDSVYQNDPAFSTTSHGERTGCATGATPSGPSCTWYGCSSANYECQPTQAGYVGPDGHDYRIDTYIRSAVLPTTTVTVKAITVVVRKATDNTELIRVQSTFDPATGT